MRGSSNNTMKMYCIVKTKAGGAIVAPDSVVGCRTDPSVKCDSGEVLWRAPGETAIVTLRVVGTNMMCWTH